MSSKIGRCFVVEYFRIYCLLLLLLFCTHSELRRKIIVEEPEFDGMFRVFKRPKGS